MGSEIVPMVNLPPFDRLSNSSGCKSRKRFTGILTKGLDNPWVVDNFNHFSKYSAKVDIKNVMFL